MKRFISVVLLILSIAVIGCSGGSKKEVEEYITALKKSDFQTLYEMNSTAQRKAALIYRRGEEAGKEDAMKKNFEENKALFDNAQADGVYGNQWTEKFLFPPDSKHTIDKVTVARDTERPTAGAFKDIKVCSAEVSVEYPNKETAPPIEDKKVKSAKYTMLFIGGENVVMGLKSKKAVNPWLFKSITVKTVTYW